MTEIERVERHPLIHTVKQRREIEVGGQTQGRKAVSGDAEERQGLVVRPARQQLREHRRTGVAHTQSLRHRVDDGYVKTVFQPNVLGHDRHVDVGTDDVPHPR